MGASFQSVHQYSRGTLSYLQILFQMKATVSLAVLPLVICSLRIVTALPAQTEISDEQLHSIHNVTDIDQDKAFRCGLFFPPELKGQLPIAALFIFNSSFPAE